MSLIKTDLFRFFSIGFAIGSAAMFATLGAQGRAEMLVNLFG